MLATHLRFLAISPKELSLKLILTPSQSFRWLQFDIHATQVDESDHQSSTEEERVEWACGFKDRTIVLRQTSQGILYRSLFNETPTPTAFIEDLQSDTTGSFISNYFQLKIPLLDLNKRWSRDRFFKSKLADGRLDGMRVLKQDPFETLISFICSANNNIPRIAKMVHSVCAELGKPLPHPLSFSPSAPLQTLATLSLPSPPRRRNKLGLSSSPDGEERSLYAFPDPSQLIDDGVEEKLRTLGFGYRAPYVRDTCQLLLSKSEPHDAYLASLSDLSADDARVKLMEFMGVGPKVASCVALFGLGFHSVVPVDVHVYQISVRDYQFPSSTSSSKYNSKPSITPIIHQQIQEKFAHIFGEHAGWAQQVLFFADLKSTIKREKGKLEAGSTIISPTKKRGRKRVTVKLEEREDEADSGASEGEEFKLVKMMAPVRPKAEEPVRVKIEDLTTAKRHRVL